MLQIVIGSFNKFWEAEKELYIVVSPEIFHLGKQNDLWNYRPAQLRAFSSKTMQILQYIQW